MTGDGKGKPTPVTAPTGTAAIDVDVSSPRGQSMRQGVAKLVERATRRTNGCLIGPRGPETYHEVKFAGRRKLAHIAVVLVDGTEVPDGHVVRHQCDTPGCVERSHLVVGTQSQNVNDEYERARRTAGWARGDGHPKSVMTESDVTRMREACRRGTPLATVIAESGFSYSSARMAIRGETWRHLATPPVAGRINKVENQRAFKVARLDDARRAHALSSAGKSLNEVGAELGVSRTTAWKLVQVAREELSA